jgi:hypothetical protein
MRRERLRTIPLEVWGRISYEEEPVYVHFGFHTSQHAGSTPGIR